MMLLIKLSLAGIAIFWLINSDKLDWQPLAKASTSLSYIITTILIWIGAILIGSGLRWYVLLKALGSNISWIQAIKLKAIGLFFNSIIPGSVSGDVVKTAYLTRLERQGQKFESAISVVADRLIGLYVGMLIAITAVALQQSALPNRTFEVIFQITLAAFIGVTICAAIILSNQRVMIKAIEYLSSKDHRFFRYAKRTLKIMEAYRQQWLSVGLAMLLTAAVHLSLIAYFCYLCLFLNGDLPVFLDISVVHLFGTISASLPIAPAGLGVGHLAYEFMYSSFGIANGANVFNLFVLGQIAMNLVAGFTYVGWNETSHVEQASRVSA